MNILLLIAGIVLLGGGIFLLIKNIKLNKNGVKIEAEIIDVKKKQQTTTDTDGYSTSSEMYYPIFRYIYEGQEYTKESSLGVSNSKKYSKGDKLNIVFMSDKPEKPKVVGVFNLWFIPGLLMFLGVVFIIVSIVV
jgi:hypothetical protein